MAKRTKRLFVYQYRTGVEQQRARRFERDADGVEYPVDFEYLAEQWSEPQEAWLDSEHGPDLHEVTEETVRERLVKKHDAPVRFLATRDETYEG